MRPQYYKWPLAWVHWHCCSMDHWQMGEKKHAKLSLKWRHCILGLYDTAVLLVDDRLVLEIYLLSFRWSHILHNNRGCSDIVRSPNSVKYFVSPPILYSLHWIRFEESFKKYTHTYICIYICVNNAFFLKDGYFIWFTRKRIRCNSLQFPKPM